MATGTRKPRWRQHLGYRAGAAVGMLALIVLLLPARESLHAFGPMNAGHEDLKCAYCHVPAPGSYRQQLQASVRYLIGQRATSADFGHQDVSNEACLACHERSDDRHPVYRFLEPRFAKARASLGPQSCMSCHREHTGRRVSLTEPGYCQHCHEDTRLRKDPVDVPHERLIAQDRWETCLGCHDFHGNHVMTTTTTLERVISPMRLRAYFEGGQSPFGEARRHKARKEPGDD